MTVSEGSAGAQLPCDCGRTVDVPSLAELRSDAGLTPLGAPLDFEVSRLLASGELPIATCAGCGGSTTEVIRFVADCEQIYVQKSGGLSWVALIFTWFHVLLVEDEVIDLHGRETVIPVPARVCDHCQREIVHAPPTSLLNRLGAFVLIAGICALCVIDWEIAALVIVCGLALRIHSSTSLKRYQRHIRQMLGTVPIYKRVFEKYPDAVVTIETGRG